MEALVDIWMRLKIGVPFPRSQIAGINILTLSFWVDHFWDIGVFHNGPKFPLIFWGWKANGTIQNAMELEEWRLDLRKKLLEKTLVP